MHLSSLSEPVAATYLPEPHLIHADVADVEYSPASQAVHFVPADDTGEALPSRVVMKPFAQVLHAVEAGAATYLPLGQSMQPVPSASRAALLALPYLPAPQLSH